MRLGFRDWRRVYRLQRFKLPDAHSGLAGSPGEKAQNHSSGGGPLPIMNAGDATYCVSDCGEAAHISSKLQAPTSREAPNTNLQSRLCAEARFVVWSLVFLWSLELGIWSFHVPGCSEYVQEPKNSVPRVQRPG